MIDRLLVTVSITATITAVRLYRENCQLRKEGEYYRQKSMAFAKMLSTTGETLIYAMDMLEKNGIEFNEFDTIVFDSQMRKILEQM